MLLDVLLFEGDRLNEHYRVTELLGRGGMGEVWKGESSDGSTVAIKVLLEHTAYRKDIRRRFEREAVAASRIQSPYVCALLDRGWTKDNSLFLVFELLHGESLAERLHREVFLPFDEVAWLLIDVLRGLHDAHRARVLHRDLKPGNVFIQSESNGERAVILDFGVSKLLEEVRVCQEPSITAFDGTVGSFAYMAPEQVRGAARVDARADVYAVACLAFRSLTGRLPFEGMSGKMVASLKLEHPPPSLKDATGFLWPTKVEQFLAKGLAKEPKKRFASAKEAEGALLEVLQFMGSIRSSSFNPTPGRTSDKSHADP